MVNVIDRGSPMRLMKRIFVRSQRMSSVEALVVIVGAPSAWSSAAEWCGSSAS
jgi:hypothetical protein